MYKKRNIHSNFVPDVVESNFKSSNPYQSFGHYVLGGLDVTGEHLQMDANVTYDSEQDIKDGCGVDALADPTVGFFQVAESMGVETAEKLASEIENQ